MNGVSENSMLFIRKPVQITEKEMLSGTTGLFIESGSRIFKITYKNKR